MVQPSLSSLRRKLQIILALVPDVMQRCDFYENFSYTVETFKRQLEPLVALALLGNWGRAAVAEAISVAPKRAMFLGQLKEALRVKPPVAKLTPYIPCLTSVARNLRFLRRAVHHD